ncbi:hypothetical protein UFOVP371_8 [uncultured Caudovirales phage]|uniref:Uncharacterized protein n=1 Tax=uncultured Caudovirales phage TaxID=2100421 RepID=A0A6J7X2D2_9CAUD|nr:hypothetical protein UFOVP371_8 [uncultured Caudovirales phage]
MKETNEEIGRIVFIVYENNFEIAFTKDLDVSDLLNVLFTTIDHLVEKNDDTVMH